MVPPVYIWKKFGGVDRLCDFQLIELTQNRGTGESIYQQFKAGSCISILIIY